MSMYHMVNGVQPETFYILPMLGKHPDEYPRFRDCVWGRLKNDKKEVDRFGIPERKKKFLKGKREISVYTRVGGGNRNSNKGEIAILRAMPTYVTDYDDDFDSTYATFIFNVPKKWEKDYDLITENKVKEISKEYRKQLDKVYPKLKDKFAKLFKQECPNPKVKK